MLELMLDALIDNLSLKLDCFVFIINLLRWFNVLTGLHAIWSRIQEQQGKTCKEIDMTCLKALRSGKLIVLENFYKSMPQTGDAINK